RPTKAGLNFLNARSSFSAFGSPLKVPPVRSPRQCIGPASAMPRRLCVRSEADDGGVDLLEREILVQRIRIAVEGPTGPVAAPVHRAGVGHAAQALRQIGGGRWRG